MSAVTSQQARPSGLRPRSSRSRVTTRFAAAQTVAFFGLMAAASVTWWPIYESADFVLLVAVSLVVGAGIALAGTFLRLASFWILILLVAAFLVLGVAVAVPSQALVGVVPTIQGLRELIGGVALGWKQLVTITLPVGGYQALLVPAFVLLLPGTVVGLTTALRSRRPELAVVPPAMVYLAGIVLGPSEALLPIVTGLVIISASVLWLVWWRLRRRRLALDELTRSTRGSAAVRSGVNRSANRAVATRAVAGALVTLLVAAGVSVGVTSLFGPKGLRWVARTAVVKPFDPRDYVSPLSGFRAYEQKPTVTSPQLTVSGLAPGEFLRIATLDTYDGVDYSVGSDRDSAGSGTFTRVPTSFDQSKVRGIQTSVDVTLDGYSGVWVPTVGKLESIVFSGTDAAARRDSFFYNDTTGTAAVVG
ncbi:MAG: hypothetical protein JWP75_3125, partial [Frondihabitans sp.]|nr:hypothetical protein [Frondihabitans sp.]